MADVTLAVVPVGISMPDPKPDANVDTGASIARATPATFAAVAPYFLRNDFIMEKEKNGKSEMLHRTGKFPALGTFQRPG